MTAMLRQSNTPTKKLKDARASAAVRLSGDDRGTGSVTRINLRVGTRNQYAHHLNLTTSKAGDRYSAATISGYLEAVDILGRYLDAQGFDGDYADVDADILNAFLADYRAGHTQGGTNTKLRRLRNFFGWLETTYEIQNPYRTGRVAYYAPGAPAPSALGPDVAQDLIDACRPTKGSPSEFEDTRDTALIELLRSGVRRGELADIWVEDIDWTNQMFQVVALKGSRREAPVLRIVDGDEWRAGRYVPVSDAAMLAVQRYLRVRAHHPRVEGRNGGPRPKKGVGIDSGPLWYGTRGRGPMTGSGIFRMIKRRAEEAGYDPATVTVHAFRHTRAHELQSAGLADGDIMGVMGWRDRSMLDRYAANLKNKRAIENVRKAGLA